MYLDEFPMWIGPDQRRELLTFWKDLDHNLDKKIQNFLTVPLFSDFLGHAIPL